MNFVLIAALCAFGPSVAVEVSASDGADSDALRGWLGARFLEEGYDLAPSAEQAAATIRVSEAGTGLAVDAVGDGVRSFAVEDGPSAVQRLEVLHRALQGVEAVASPAASRPPGLVVRVSGRDHDALMTELANAARDSGVHLRTEAGEDDALLCVASRGGLAEIGLGPASSGCAPADSVAAVGSRSERERMAAEAIERALQSPAFATEVAPDLLGTEPDPVLSRIVADGERSSGRHGYTPPPPVVVVEDFDSAPAPMHGPARAEVRLAVEGGVVVRGAPDAAMRGRVRLGRINGVGGRFELGIVPSRAPGMRVMDTFLMVGPDWQIGLGKRARLLLAASAGADIHTFTTDQESAAEVNWALALPVGASLKIRGDTRVHLMVHPGLSGVTTRHERRNVADWERAIWRVGVSLGFSHGWRIE
ncbi:MAG: hypothetical protein AAF721_41685 [Myxococcota bacterium]